MEKETTIISPDSLPPTQIEPFTSFADSASSSGTWDQESSSDQQANTPTRAQQTTTGTTEEWEITPSDSKESMVSSMESTSDHPEALPGKNNIGMIVGVVVGLLVVILIVIILVVVFVVKRKRRTEESEAQVKDHEFDTTGTMGYLSDGTENETLMTNDIEIGTQDNPLFLTDENAIGDMFGDHFEEMAMDMA